MEYKQAFEDNEKLEKMYQLFKARLLDELMMKERKQPRKKEFVCTTEEIEDFERFWYAGLQKLGNKQKCLEKYTQIKREQPDLDLVKDVQKRIRLKQFGFDRLHPQTYLNNERWNDDYPEEVITLLKLPRENDDLYHFAMEHKLPQPAIGETYPNYRKRLTKIIEENKLRGE